MTIKLAEGKEQKAHYCMVGSRCKIYRNDTFKKTFETSKVLNWSRYSLRASQQVSSICF